MTLASYVSLSAAFREKGDAGTLLAAASLSFVPLCVFDALLHLGTGANSSPFFFFTSSPPYSFLTDNDLLTVVVAFFQAWGAGIVGAGMSVASRQDREDARGQPGHPVRHGVDNRDAGRAALLASPGHGPRYAPLFFFLLTASREFQRNWK